MFTLQNLGVSAGGLFSPDYAGTAWSFGKVLDLIKHLPVPIIVIGTAGTASLIRVMRGALLDELAKQYVVTARAKGVGERALLFRYPVRVAINPIISTVGWLLPEIVSGSYRLFGLLDLDRHLFSVEPPGGVFLFGTDTIGRDVYSRTIHAARVSLFIGLAGVALTFVIGVTLGGISGYFGGRADMLIQRLIEFLMSLPTIPLWLALSAAMPRDWPILRIYFGIVIVLSLASWGRLARVVRGKLLELRELDFVTAARLAGMKESRIIRGHLLPNFAGYLIVSVSLDIPTMILAETALSFLGLGLRSPAVSWGVLLQDAHKLRSVAAFPWLIIPALFVVVAVLAFNFLGDGLRDEYPSIGCNPQIR